MVKRYQLIPRCQRLPTKDCRFRQPPYVVALLLVERNSRCLKQDGREVKNKMSKKMSPGEKAPYSGQYAVVGPRGGNTGVERTVVKGEPLPPPPAPGQKYRLTDRTKTS